MSVGVIFKHNFISIDIDNQTLKKVINTTREYQLKYHLGNAVLVRTSKNHYQTHFFWNIMSWKKVIKHLKKHPLIDKDFLQHRIEYGENRMRITIKPHKPVPKIIRIIKSPYHKNNPKGDFMFEQYKFLLNLFK